METQKNREDAVLRRKENVWCVLRKKRRWKRRGKRNNERRTWRRTTIDGMCGRERLVWHTFSRGDVENK